MGFLLTVLGVVLVLEGVPWFLSPRGTKKRLLKMLVIPDAALRLGGLAAMLGGLLMVWLGQR
ncbi:MAG: DUF2065 domain-containing protein [Desulfuromonadales bacterium]|nr:DUF2065 domain-containing protein [Desulfuromonadales bacterium]